MIDYVFLEKLLPFYCVFIGLIIIFLMSLISEKDKYVSFSCLILSTYILSIFSGSRTDTVAPDFPVYENIFNSIYHGYSFSSHVEIGYLFLNKAVATFTSDFNVFLILFTLISISIISSVYYKASRFPILSIILYFVHYYLGRDFIAIRSALAYAIVFLSLIFYNENKDNRKYLLGVLLASLFHKTALLSLIIIPIKFMYERFGFYKVFGFSLLCSIFILILNPKNYLIHIASLIYGENSVIFEKYFEGSDILYDLGIFNPVNLKNLFLISIALFYFRERERFLLLVFSIASFLLLSFHEFGLLAARSLSQLIIIDTIIIPLICSKVKVEHRVIAFMLVFFYSLIMLTINISRPGAYFYDSVLF